MSPKTFKDTFESYSGPIAHKLEHYVEIYERCFHHLKTKPISLLEIGISRGGSLNIWREYFHPASVVVGIDINPACKIHDRPSSNIHARIGSQADTKFLDEIFNEFGNFDLVIDDGSHQMNHVITTFRHIFPKLSESSIYFIEDMCCSYWPRYGGGVQTPGTVIEFAKELIDLLNIQHWRTQKNIVWKEFVNECKSIQFYDSVIVFEKGNLGSNKPKLFGT
jgi:cephalosporin hydroxylase